ncbi:DUF3108 domain-containing protein [Ramlibacter sp. RBP-2]|uniref:DUF3108 domain-containing protein n=1 Tax=Ramlibacter lithotrophicus TaxID=2606681 RepID=A0A7X6DID9_9BURK|nr:DUF3108 domain-containing protein [Ramlibacter lithotrophicus]
MAGAGRLSGRTARRWLALLAAVLLLHLAALDWIGRRLQHTGLLQPLAEPMFTRVLQPQAPPEPPAAAPAPAPASTRPAVRTVAPAAPKPAAPASTPGEAEPLPEPPAPVAEATEPSPLEEVAAAPVVPASAPAVADRAPAAPPAAEAAAPPSLEGWPLDTRVNYRLGGAFRSGDLHGDARVQWLRQDDRYEVRIDIDVTLLARLVMTSQGAVTPQGLKPEVYEEQRRSGVRRATLREGTILLGNGEVVPRPAGVQDTASQFVELSHRFASGRERLEVGRSVEVWLARPGHLALWTYDVVARETLQTPGLGPVDAFHLKPRPLANPRGNITAEMWFAPSLQYLPVRIKVNMDPAYVDLMVESIEQR